MRQVALTLLLLGTILGFFVGEGPFALADTGIQQGTLYPSANERFGFGVVTDISRFDVGKLHAGWYVNWGSTSRTKNPAGLEYVQIIRLCDSQYRSCNTPYSPYGDALVETVRSNPGTLWLIGNEPDRIYTQDSVHPTVYAQLYHELYYLIKSIDPTARIANGGIVQATPLRMQWLNMVWDEYQRLYGETMPVDVWNIHTFVLRELKPGLPLDEVLRCAPPGARELGAWGADIPPGIDANCGLWIEISDLDRMDLLQDQVLRFRRWMRNHGQREKELIVSEYGILFNEELGYDFERVRDYMYNTFNYFLNARDSELGMPDDENRLVQRWAWYSLDDNSFGWGTTWGALFDPDTGQITPMGEAYAAYTAPLITPYVDLEPVSLTYRVLESPIWAIEPTKLELRGTVTNWGNTVADLFRVRFWDGPVGTGTLIKEKSIPSLPSRYQGNASATVIWSRANVQGATISFQVDARREIEEPNEDNNTLSTTVNLPLDLAITAPSAGALPPLTPTGAPIDVPVRVRIQSLGGRGSDTGFTVEFWHGDPQGGGTMIDIVEKQPGSDATAEIIWRNLPPGYYQVYARLVGVEGDANPDNDTAIGDVFVGVTRQFFPLAAVRR